MKKIKENIGLILFFAILILVVVSIIGSRYIKKNKDNEENIEDTSQVNNNNQQTDEKFYYDEFGNKLSYGDTNMSSEDVIYTFVKSLALLDFSTAQTYVYNGNSYVVSGYETNNSSFSGGSGYSIAYNFTHKIYKKLLSSLKVEKILDTVIMQDKQIITVEIEHLDFNNNEFWLKDKETLFNNIYIYYKEENAESANAKVNEYLSEYIKEKYESKDAPKKTDEVELEVVKSSTGAWVINSDVDLYNLSIYNDGSYSINNIKQAYSDWFSENKQN